MPVLHNCHTHVFTIHQIPDEVHWAIRFLRNRTFVRVLRRSLPLIHPLLNLYLTFGSPARAGIALRLLALLDIGVLDEEDRPTSQENIFRRLSGAYPKGSKFVVLPIDMDYISGEHRPAPQSFEEQLEALRGLRDTFPETVLPFVGADPRRPNMLELVKTYIEEHGFLGVKLYPSLGFCPSDERLDELYCWAEQKQVPILTHCTPGGIHTRTFPKAWRHPMLGWPFFRPTYAELAARYTHPSNYDPVLEKYPDLKLCLAHLGGAGECRKFLEQHNDAPKEERSWTTIILGQIRQNANVYADLSFTGYDRDLLPLFKVLANTPKVQDRLLFGSDFYVVRTEAAERDFSIRVRGSIGEEEYWRMANDNAGRFLGPYAGEGAETRCSALSP